MKIGKKIASTAIAAGVAVGLVACGGGDPLAAGNGDDAASRDSIIVGSADFAESQLLGTIYAQVLENAGVEVEERPNIGSREVYLTAIQDGSIDLIPEYNGYLLQQIVPDADTSDRENITKQLYDVLPEGVTVLDWASAENTNVLVVTQEFSDAHGGLASISELAEANAASEEAGEGTFSLAGPPEWRTRPKTGLPGIRDSYGLDFADTFQVLDGGGPLSLTAVVNGQVDVAMLLSSDPAIADNDLVALEDDKVIFPPANIMPMISEAKASDTVRDALNEVTAALTIDDLMMMNGRVNEGIDFEVIASDWLTEKGLI